MTWGTCGGDGEGFESPPRRFSSPLPIFSPGCNVHTPPHLDELGMGLVQVGLQGCTPSLCHPHHIHSSVGAASGQSLQEPRTVRCGCRQLLDVSEVWEGAEEAWADLC